MAIRLSVELELPDEESAARLQLALRNMADQEGWRVSFDGEMTCRECGRLMTWSRELGIYVCVHIENSLQGG